MGQLSKDPARARRAASRRCGTCSHCCTVLRVDEIGKPAAKDCIHQRGERGCGIHDERPAVCRGYHCLWLQGGLEEDERPDRTGGIVDLEAVGFGVELQIKELTTGAFESSPALQAIAERYRSEMPVRITDLRDLDDADRPFRVLLAEGLEHRTHGDRIETYQNGELTNVQTLPWAERLGRRISIWWRRRKLARLEGGPPS